MAPPDAVPCAATGISSPSSLPQAPQLPACPALQVGCPHFMWQWPQGGVVSRVVVEIGGWPLTEGATAGLPGRDKRELFRREERWAQEEEAEALLGYGRMPHRPPEA